MPAKKKATVRRTAPAVAGVQHIEVDQSGIAVVTTTPRARHFIKAQDKVRFTSNRDDTEIVYVVDSPFDTTSVPARVRFKIGRGKGPFKCVLKGIHHFDCGRDLGGQFSPWAPPPGEPRVGGDTPVDDGPHG